MALLFWETMSLSRRIRHQASRRQLVREAFYSYILVFVFVLLDLHFVGMKHYYPSFHREYLPVNAAALQALFWALIGPALSVLHEYVLRRGDLWTSYSSLILTTLVLAVLMNGFLDKSPRSTVTTVVLGKTRHTSRSGTDYTLTVASWRPRRTSEDFQVSSFDFQRALVGRKVRIELHKGFFNIPWSGNISPE